MHKTKRKNEPSNLKPYWIFFLLFTATLAVMAFYPLRTLILWELNILFWGFCLFRIGLILFRIGKQFGWRAKSLIMLQAICLILTFSQFLWSIGHIPPSGFPFYDRSCESESLVETSSIRYATWETGFTCYFWVGTPHHGLIERYVGWRILAIRTGETAIHWG